MQPPRLLKKKNTRRLTLSKLLRVNPNPKRKGVSIWVERKEVHQQPWMALDLDVAEAFWSLLPPGPVAVKFVRKRSSLVEELQHEAHVYQQLAQLQGSVLPKLYHAGPVDNGKHYGLCLQPVGINVSEALELGVTVNF